MDVGLVCLRPEPRYTVALLLKLLKYMEAVHPVIDLNFSLCKKIVEGNKCGLALNLLDPEKIACSIEHLITNHEVARSMGDKGYLAVDENYNWGKGGQKLIKFYEELLAT